MSIEAIQGLGDSQPATLQASEIKPSQTGFVELFNNGIAQLSESLHSADAAFQAMALDKPVSTHEVMLTMEKAKRELRLAVEIRNKLLEGYQEIMRMQV